MYECADPHSSTMLALMALQSGLVQAAIVHANPRDVLIVFGNEILEAPMSLEIAVLRVHGVQKISQRIFRTRCEMDGSTETHN